MKNKTFIILFFVLAIIYCSIYFYTNRGWSTDNKLLCVGQTFYSKEDMLNGYLCIYNESTFDKCSLVKTNLNSEVRECTCLRNNKKVKSYCDTKVKVYTYNKGFKPTDNDIKDVENYLEKQTNISLDKYFNRNKTEGGK